MCFLISYAGCAEGTKASDLNDYNSQRHIWYHLAPRYNGTRRRGNNQP